MPAGQPTDDGAAPPPPPEPDELLTFPPEPLELVCPFGPLGSVPQPEIAVKNRPVVTTPMTEKERKILVRMESRVPATDRTVNEFPPERGT